MALRVKPLNSSHSRSRAMLIANCSASNMISSWRSRSGGRVITSKARRSSKSLLNSPCSARVGKSSLVAQTNRVSTLTVCLPPTRSNSPYSITRSSFSCTIAEVLANSSRNSVPPLARSKRPSWRLLAPVNAPLS